MDINEMIKRAKEFKAGVQKAKTVGDASRLVETLTKVERKTLINALEKVAEYIPLSNEYKFWLNTLKALDYWEDEEEARREWEMITREEMIQKMKDLKRKGWEHIYSVTADDGSGGLFFHRKGITIRMFKDEILVVHHRTP